MTAPKIVMPSQIVMRATASLIGYARNSRTHDERQIDVLCRSITEYGFTNPILIDGDRGVIAGHGRIMAAEKLGLVEVPCIELRHLTNDQKRAYLILDNQSALMSTWSEALLAQELADLSGVGIEATDLGFDAAEVDRLMETLGVDFGGKAEGDPDAVPEAPVVPTSKLGDVWLLGKHRVMCGDSTDRAQVERLMDGKKADICFTSPPYALGKNASLSNNANIALRGCAYDQHADDPLHWPHLMSGWWIASLPFVSAWAVNIQPLAGNKRELINWINERSSQLVDIATWDKRYAAPQMAGGVMASRFEWIVFFGKENASRAIPFASWQGTVQSVYASPPQRDNQFAAIHGASMPVHLSDWVISEICDKAQTVFDPFGGTGTTTISCEKSHKSSRLMEISPAYVDVIVRRWQDFAGKAATLDGDGRTFAEIAEARRA
jgi:DNA modification methylase